MAARIMVLGLDGGTWDLLEPWIEAGQLPNLAALRARAAWGRLRSTTPPFSATAWTTFATGMNPGQHGIFDFWIRREGKKEPISSLAVGAPTLWGRLSQAGCRVAVINLPVTYPPRPVNGVMVSGMMTPSERTVYTYPAELKAQLQAIAGKYCADPYAAITQSQGFLREAKTWVQRRERAHRWLLLREPWDLFINVIQAPDPIQHYFWTFLLPGHPDYDTKEGKTFRTLALEVFREIDAIVGQRLELLGPHDTLLMMSDHGAGEATHWFNLNRWLAEAGFLALADHGRPRVLAGRLDGGKVFDLLRQFDVFHLRQRVGNLTRQRLRERVDRLMTSAVDWTRTVAYAASPSAEAIYINTEGYRLRGAAYERVRSELAEGLLSLAGPDGGPVVEAVHRREELYHGPYLEQAPDLVLEIGHCPYILSEAFSARQLFTEIPFRAARGRHRPEGILLISGPQVERAGERAPARLEDLAPTVLALLGLPVPAEMDGRILTDWLEGVSPARATPSPIEISPQPVSAPPPYSPEEAALIAQRLRNLGYLD